MATVDPAVVSRWTARIVPPILVGFGAYATYVHLRLCINYLFSSNAPVATALLVVYFVLFFPMTICYFRLLLVVHTDAGYVPQGPESQRQKKTLERGRRARREAYSQEYESTQPNPARNNADSPGLEDFYRRDLFVCESDGRPLWCSQCANWKPDRAHHCSDVGRCVRKMDHFCPWVGGVVGETSFKFFLQFVIYTALFTSFEVVVMAIYVHEQAALGILDEQIVIVLGVAAFFCLFTIGMSWSSGFLAVANLTTIENLSKATYKWRLAVLIPDRPTSAPHPKTDSPDGYTTVTYPLPIPDVGVQSNKESRSERTKSSLETLSERDAKAKHTFAILTLSAGQNPWDVGPMGNWKSVMGNSFIDWFLPIKHSPCRNHEDPESQFPSGRWVERLKVHHGLMMESEKCKPRPFARGGSRKRRRRSDVELGGVSNRRNADDRPGS